MNPLRLEEIFRPLVAVVVVTPWLLLTGCGERVYSDYAARKGAYNETSLNGTRVLSDLFEAAGHRVRTRHYLSPGLEKANVIVWFPDDFEPPTAEAEHWLSNWLLSGDAGGTPRTLIYVGRDFDAAPDYWQKMQSQPPPGLKREYARRLSEAQGDAAARQPAKLSRPETDDWFKLDIAPPQATVKGLTGPWAEDIDPAQVEIERNARLIPLGDEHDVLLGDENSEPLVCQRRYLDYGDSQPLGRLIMIENGSWLLNARLVNREHRKLAARLVESVGPAPQLVVFLQSDAGGPAVLDSDPSATPPTGLQLFRVWPIGAVLAQLAVLGIVFALMKWPIFGTPKRLRHASITDFGSHVAALGRLLRYGGNRSHAIGLLRMYRHASRRESQLAVESASAPPPSPESPSPTALPE